MNDIAKVQINLDTVEREKSYEPFSFVLDGEALTLTDPADLDWQVLASIEKPVQFFRHCFQSEDDREKFRKAKLPGWKLNELISTYIRHYGLDTAGNGAGSAF